MDKMEISKLIQDQIELLNTLNRENCLDLKSTLIQNLQLLVDRTKQSDNNSVPAPLKKLKVNANEDLSTKTDPQDQIVIQDDGHVEFLLQLPAEILNMILNLLSFSTLKQLRLVNSSWNGIASNQILTAHPPRPLIFIFNKDNNSFQTYIKSKSNYLLLNEFVENQANSMVNIFNNFGFVNANFCSTPNNTETEELMDSFNRFLVIQGKHIKILHLDSVSMDIDYLCKILMEGAPHVEILELDFIKHLQWTNLDRFSLPHLKSINCLSETENSTVLNMISSAPNLKSVHNFKLSYMDRLLSICGGCGGEIVKSISKNTLKAEHQEQLLKLVQFKPQLVRLHIPELTFTHNGQLIGNAETELRKCLSLLLESSQNSLKYLRVEGSLQVNELKLPSDLKNVKVLELKQYVMIRLEPQLVLPADLVLAQYFSALTCFSFIYVCDYRAPLLWRWKDFFQDVSLSEQCPHVQKLELGTQDFSFWLRKFAPIMPNVIKLTIKVCEYISQNNYISDIHDFYNNLQQLRIEDDGSADADDDNDVLQTRDWKSLLSDSQFTGIQEEMCKRLKVSAGEPKQNRWKRKERNGLENFEYLELLYIRLRNESWSEREMIAIKLPSQVSAIYGFRKHLNVVFVYDQNCHNSFDIKSALGSISPYVTVVDGDEQDWIDAADTSPTNLY